jgi:hypothetical protein
MSNRVEGAMGGGNVLLFGTGRGTHGKICFHLTGQLFSRQGAWMEYSREPVDGRRTGTRTE